MTLTLAQANKAVEAAICKAQELDIRICVAVCDAGGRLLAFSRMEGAGWASIYGSQGKAVTSAATGVPSGRIPADLHVMQKIAEHEGGHMIYSQGAVPIIRSGCVMGAIGAGGGTGQEDEDCAAAGEAVIS